MKFIKINIRICLLWELVLKIQMQSENRILNHLCEPVNVGDQIYLELISTCISVAELIHVIMISIFDIA